MIKANEDNIKRIVMVSLFSLLGVSTYFVAKGYICGAFNSIYTLQEYINGFGIIGPLVIILIQMLQVILPVLPGFAGCIAGTSLFGPVVGFWTNYIGISLGSIIDFMLAKQYGIQLVSKMVSMEKYNDLIERLNKSKNYVIILFLSIILPLAPDDFLCYFSGLIDLSYKKFCLIIIIAKPWCILFYCIFFSYFL